MNLSQVNLRGRRKFATVAEKNIWFRGDFKRPVISRGEGSDSCSDRRRGLSKLRFLEYPPPLILPEF